MPTEAELQEQHQQVETEEADQVREAERISDTSPGARQQYARAGLRFLFVGQRWSRIGDGWEGIARARERSGDLDGAREAHCAAADAFARAGRNFLRAQKLFSRIGHAERAAEALWQAARNYAWAAQEYEKCGDLAIAGGDRAEGRARYEQADTFYLIALDLEREREEEALRKGEDAFDPRLQKKFRRGDVERMKKKMDEAREADRREAEDSALGLLALSTAVAWSDYVLNWDDRRGILERGLPPEG